MCAPDVKPPDYTGAAQAQGEANLDTARVNARLNNPNYIGPTGTRTVQFGAGGQVFDQAAFDEAMADYQKQLDTYNTESSFQHPYQAYGLFGGSPSTPKGSMPVPPNMANFYNTGNPDQVTITDVLSPEQQKLFDTEQAIKSDLLNTAQGGLNRVSGQMETPFDLSQVQDYSVTPDVAGREAIVQALMDRQQPFLERARTGAENDLLIQGHNRGGEAWNAVQDDLARYENDALINAILAGGQEQSRLAGLESARRGQDIQEQAYLRNLPLSEINALRTGNQPLMPQFQPYQGVNIGAAPLFDATLAQGNFQLQNAQNKTAGRSGLFDLGGSIFGAAGASGGFGNLFGF